MKRFSDRKSYSTSFNSSIAANPINFKLINGEGGNIRIVHGKSTRSYSDIDAVDLEMYKSMGVRFRLKNLLQADTHVVITGPRVGVLYAPVMFATEIRYLPTIKYIRIFVATTGDNNGLFLSVDFRI